jgi:outer membrane protein assembly factor BamD
VSALEEEHVNSSPYRGMEYHKMQWRRFNLRVTALPLWLLLLLSTSHGAWIWTRETGRFRNVNDITMENAREQLQYAETFEKKGDYKGALREYKKTLKQFPASAEAATATFKMGVCYEELDKPDKAFKAYQEVLEKYPSYPDPEEALRRQFGIARDYYLGKRRPFPLIKLRLFKARGAAIEYFNKMVDLAAELQERKKNFDGAIESYQFVVEHYPQTAAAETALFRIAWCHYEKALRARYDEKSIMLANTTFKSYVEKYPEGEHVKEARDRLMSLDDKKAKGAFEVGRFYEKKKKFQSALMYYTEVLQRHPLSAWAVKAEERIQAMRKRGVLEEVASETGS